VLKNRLERTKPRLSLVPLAAGGPGGGAFAGLGLRITEF
jgi:hypothetical protein